MNFSSIRGIDSAVEVLVANAVVRPPWARCVLRRGAEFGQEQSVAAGESGISTLKVSGAGVPKVRRAPTLAMKMAKPWPVLASA